MTNRHALVFLLAAGLLPGGAPLDAEAQFSDPCEATCAATLGASSFVFAMGTMAAVGRLEGGYTTKMGPAATFGGAFLASVGGGVALHGNGDRQRRAIYGSALGAAGGALMGLAGESLIGEHDSASRWAAVLVGGAIGVLVGGALGAATYDHPPEQSPVFPLGAATISLPTISLPVGR